MNHKIEAIEKQYADLEARLETSSSLPQLERQELLKRYSDLRPLMQNIREWRKVSSDIKEAKEIIRGPEVDLHPLALAELAERTRRLSELEGHIRVGLLPKDPHADKNVFLEIRAGAGGDEAALFAGDLLRMYVRYCTSRGWRVEELESTATGLKGIKQVTLFVRGNRAYSWLKFEGGVHRVQRVPVTEASGRIHTSTCTVAVLPEAEEVEIEINPKDLRIDTYRAGGAGGQNVNKVETAIRITHLPSQIVVQCQDERSQGQNRVKAMMILRAKLASLAQDQAISNQAQDRRRQVGTGDRSEKIRTYNFPQNRITDHRLERSWYNLEEILEGALSSVIEALRQDEEKRLLETGG